MKMTTTGCRERGWKRRSQDICGRRDIGVTKATGIAFTTDIGDQKSDSTAELIMDMDTPDADTREDAGRDGGSTTTAR